MRAAIVLISLFSIFTLGWSKNVISNVHSNSNNGHGNNNNNQPNNHGNNNNNFDWPSQQGHHGYDIDPQLWSGVGLTQYQSLIKIAQMVNQQCAATTTATAGNAQGNSHNNNQGSTIGTQMLAQVCPRWTNFVVQFKAMVKQMFDKYSCALPSFFDQILTSS